MGVQKPSPLNHNLKTTWIFKLLFAFPFSSFFGFAQCAQLLGSDLHLHLPLAETKTGCIPENACSAALWVWGLFEVVNKWFGDPLLKSRKASLKPHWRQTPNTLLLSLSSPTTHTHTPQHTHTRVCVVFTTVLTPWQTAHYSTPIFGPATFLLLSPLPVPVYLRVPFPYTHPQTHTHKHTHTLSSGMLCCRSSICLNC